MAEHLPECWSTYPSDPPAWCICEELRAREARVIAAAAEALAEQREQFLAVIKMIGLGILAKGDQS